MTISNAAATGVSNTTAARGSTSTTVAYTGVADGRLAVITASVKPSTATLGTIDGWVLLTNTTGGTGTNAADTGTSRIGKYYRILNGSETGSVTVTAGSSPSALEAVMDVYSSTLGGWVTPIGVSASDTSHGTNASGASGTWASALAAGDWVHAGYGTDTDSTTATTGQGLTQTSVTFGTVTARSQLRNSTGNQGSVMSWDAPVGSGGSTSALTMSLTWGASSCGAFAATRLREATPVLTSTLTSDFTSAPAFLTVLYGGAAVTGGALSIPCTTTYAGGYTDDLYRFDSWHVQVTPAPQAGATTECYTGLFLQPPGTATGTDIGFYVDRITGELVCANRVGYSDGGATRITYDPVNHAWWRLALSGTNIIWQTSPDGSTWTTRRTLAIPSWVNAQPGMRLLFDVHRGEGTDNASVFDNLSVTPVTSVNAPAEAATGSGTAPTPTLAAAPSAAPGTGTGQAATPTPAAELAADQATGTGTAPPPSPAAAPTADAAPGTGAAPTPGVTTSGTAGVAAGSGVAPDGQPSLAGQTDAATGSGQAPDATVVVQEDITAAPATATGSGQAPDATVHTTPTADPAAGSGVAQQPSPTAAPTGGGTEGSGTASSPAPAVAAAATAATGAGSALDATATTAAETNAPAGYAAGTGTAYDATARVDASPGAATGAGTGTDPQPSITSNAALAGGVGVASNANIDLQTAAATVGGTGEAPDATVGSSTGALADVAQGSGAAYGASVTTETTAAPATGSGNATGGQAETGGQAGQATGSGAAGQPTTTASTTAPPATGAGTAEQSTTDTRPAAATATGTGQAPEPVAEATNPAYAGTATATGQANPGTITAVTLAALGQGVGAALDAAAHTASDIVDFADLDPGLLAVDTTEGGRTTVSGLDRQQQVVVVMAEPGALTVSSRE